MINVNKFYVYEHWRPDINEPFYVGKGCRNRAYRFGIKAQRNLHHQAIEKKLLLLGLAIEVKIVARFANGEEAYTYEMERIAHWRALGMGLVNRTAGGEGIRDPSLETRALISKWHKGRKLSDETRARMRASQAKRPPQTPEQIEKARRNRLANSKPMRDSTKALLSTARKSEWEKIKNDPIALEKLKLQRSVSGKKRWATLNKDPARVKEIRAKQGASNKRTWTIERRVRQMAIAREMNYKRAEANGFVKKKPKYVNRYVPKFGRGGPNGNTGKKMPEHLKEMFSLLHKGVKKSPEFCEKQRAAWTPERKAKQAEVARRVWLVHRNKLLGRVKTREEIEKARAKNIGRKDSPEARQRKRDSWTPARRAAMAARTAERNRIRAAMMRAQKLTSETVH